jgi:aryl-alcohol dehydrogenase-like predicted oxidoreductase
MTNDRANLSYRRLGRSDLEISNVGLGTLAISGRFHNADDEQSMRTMRRAVDAGINWFHTAPSYGTGYGEVMVGRALREIPEADRPLVFTTAGWVFDRADEGDDSAVRTKSLAPESIRKQVDGSLRRLGIERIDLLQFHWPDHNTPIEESWGCVAELVAEGKVRAAGLSNHPLPLIQRCEAVFHVDALQQPLSLLDRSMNGPYFDAGRDSGGLEVLEWAHDHQTGVITFAPLQHGLLAGRYTKDSVAQFAQAGDPLRPSLYWFQEPTFSRALQLVERLRPVAARHEVSLASIAIAWTLAWSGVTGAICGARKPEQLDDFLVAAGLTLTESDLDEIADAIHTTQAAVGTAGDGPGRPVTDWTTFHQKEK